MNQSVKSLFLKAPNGESESPVVAVVRVGIATVEEQALSERPIH